MARLLLRLPEVLPDREHPLVGRPTVNAAIGTTYVPADRARPGTKLEVDVRGKRSAAEVVKLPFVPHRTKK